MKNAKPSNSPLTLGIEGGGTKTTWALVDRNGRVVREGRTDAGNLNHLSDAQTFALLKKIHTAVGPKAEVSAIGGAFSGLHLPSEKKKVEGMLRKLWPRAKKVFAGEDTRSAFAGAHGRGNGLIVIAGTGSNVQGHKDGRWEKAGGWGALCGDPGSGYDLARRGLEAVYLHYDRTQKVTALGRAYLTHSGCKDLTELVAWVLNLPSKTEIAAMGRCVITAAKTDRIAREVLHARAGALADAVQNVTRRLKLKQPDIGLVGSALEKNPGYRKIFEAAVRKRVKVGKIFVVTVPGPVGAAKIVADFPAAK